MSTFHGMTSCFHKTIVAPTRAPQVQQSSRHIGLSIHCYIFWFLSKGVMTWTTIPDMNHNTWWFELKEWHTLPRIKKIATKPGEQSEPWWSRRSLQYLRRLRSKATSCTSLPVLSQRELWQYSQYLTWTTIPGDSSSQSGCPAFKAL